MFFAPLEKSKKLNLPPKALTICPQYQKTGQCVLKLKCPNALGHRRCKLFLFGKCANIVCANFHDIKERSLLFQEEICKEFKLNGKCSQDSNCKYSKFHKACSYFLKGECRKGEKCCFFHDNKSIANQMVNREEKKQPEADKVRNVCKFFLKNKCKFISCRDLHVCPFFLSNNCKYDDKCKFPHKIPADNSFIKPSKTPDEISIASEDNSSHAPSEMDDLCCICYDNPITHAATPCGHNIYCQNCIVLLKFCAKCREKIDNIIRIYK